MTDLYIIKRLEQEINNKLEQITLDYVGERNGYTLDKNNNVIGLNLDKSELSIIPNEMVLLENLQKLSISGNKLEVLPESFSQLQNLTELYLGSNQLTELPPSFGQLQNLTYLWLNGNQLRKLPTSFGQLQNLTYLWLNGNQLQKLPASFVQLCNLNELELWNNQLKELPPSFGYLQNLKELYLGNNQLQNLPASFSQLQSLNALILSSNQLSALPLSFGQLQNLSILDLRYNQLQELPVSFSQLKKSCQLSVFENPLEIPPYEVAKQGIKAINNYFIERERLPLNEAKVLIVGQGGVGKTSLVNRLISNIFDNNENKTDGISIQNWEVNINSQQIRLNIWDFGGQEIMHATHQFFLTKRSLYLLVLDARQEEQYSRVEYWLKMIETYGGKSPILIAINKSDQHQSELNETQLRRDYPNIKGFYTISCKQNDNIYPLKQHIFTCIDELPHVHDLLPKTWFDIKTKLEKMRRDYMPYTEYEKICNRESIDTSSQVTLIDFLHDLGIVLNYRDDRQRPHLKETNILNPEWITEGIYKIINSNQLFQSKGILKFEQLSQILDSRRYPIKKHPFIIDIMGKFELCFKFPEQENCYLVPDLLSRQEPYLNWNEEENSLLFELHYDVLPSSIISRFIVRQHRIALKQTYWRTGIVVKQDNNKALIIANLETKKIAISIIGTEQGRRALLATVRKSFGDIHDTIKGLKLTEKVRYKNILIPFQHLLNAEEVGEKTYFIAELKEKVELLELINGVDCRRKNYSNNYKSKPMNLPNNKSPIQPQNPIKLYLIIVVLALMVTISVPTSIVFFPEINIPPELCTYAIWLKDKNTLKVIKEAKVSFTYKNTKYVSYVDSEGFHRLKFECSQDNELNEGKMYIDGDGYEIYERVFTLNRKEVQEFHLTPLDPQIFK
ncbi:COR domain-containing protein [Candidatus Albibeggiatoa sp. nov. NOAA]|uniref:COR domain-containing protein n=1 Tax=Candidatus Albibeggiatoa sp. nov. NOAA TaxID=3162724 RepID=UPI003300AF4E|nr:leucine-rich repeat domain-containing protein [Thiotrichaceae bacterium]